MNKPLTSIEGAYQPMSKSPLEFRFWDERDAAVDVVDSVFNHLWVQHSAPNQEHLRLAEEALARMENRAAISEDSWTRIIASDFAKLRD